MKLNRNAYLVVRILRTIFLILPVLQAGYMHASELKNVFRNYLDAANEFNKQNSNSAHDVQRLMQFNKLWRQQLAKSIAITDDNKMRGRVLRELRALDCALGDFRSAFFIARELAATQEVNDVTDYAFGVTLLSRLILNEDDLNSTEYIDYLDDAFSIFTEKLNRSKYSVDGLNVMGDIFKRVGYGSRAVECYVEAATAIEQSGTKGQLGLLYGDVILLKAAQIVVQEGMANMSQEDVEEFKTKLIAFKGGAYEPGYRVYALAKLVDPTLGSAYSDSIKRSIEYLAPDSWTPYLLYELAESSMMQVKFEDAAYWYGRFLDMDFKSFRPHSPAIQDPAKLILDSIESFKICLDFLGGGNDPRIEKMEQGLKKKLQLLGKG